MNFLFLFSILALLDAGTVRSMLQVDDEPMPEIIFVQPDIDEQIMDSTDDSSSEPEEEDIPMFLNSPPSPEQQPELSPEIPVTEISGDTIPILSVPSPNEPIFVLEYQTAPTLLTPVMEEPQEELLLPVLEDQNINEVSTQEDVPSSTDVVEPQEELVLPVLVDYNTDEVPTQEDVPSSTDVVEPQEEIVLPVLEDQNTDEVPTQEDVPSSTDVVSANASQEPLSLAASVPIPVPVTPFIPSPVYVEVSPAVVVIPTPTPVSVEVSPAIVIIPTPGPVSVEVSPVVVEVPSPLSVSSPSITPDDDEGNTFLSYLADLGRLLGN